MAEQRAAKEVSDWLRPSRGSYQPSYVVSFDANQSHIVRVLDKTSPYSVWRHTARTPEGRFVKAFCCGDFDNLEVKCPLCLINNSDKYKDLKGRDKPFPKGSEYVKAVWSYTHNKPMLLVGNDIWSNIDTIRATTDICGYDINVTRKDEKDKPTSYSATIIPERKEFNVVVDPATIPLPSTYEQWLKDNLAKVSITVPAAPAAASSLLGRTEGTSNGGTQVPANMATKESLGLGTAKRDADKKRFGEIINKRGWDSALSVLIVKIIEGVNGRRKLISANSPVANDLEGLTDAEYEEFVNAVEADGKK